MVSAKIYLEGGGTSKELGSRCREGFRKLIESMGYAGRMPRLVACGGRGHAFEAFKIGHDLNDGSHWVGLWIDSEQPVADLEAPWQHLRVSDSWDRPPTASDDQVPMAVTCLETWLVAHRAGLRSHYGPGFQESALPATDRLEELMPEELFAALVRATARCKSSYGKGTQAFTLLRQADPAIIEQGCPSLARCRRILDEHL